jgi:hypothetical protein
MRNVLLIVSFAVLLACMGAQFHDSGVGGFDEFGYNYKARIFVGPADGVDKVLDGAVWGDPTYANDHLVMSWSKGWDNARFNGGAWGPDCWEDNEWNGMAPDGSRYTEHFKCVWCGTPTDPADPTTAPYWREGGYLIWGQFEAIMDHGMDPEHSRYVSAFANPCGYGGK